MNDSAADGESPIPSEEESEEGEIRVKCAFGK